MEAIAKPLIPQDGFGRSFLEDLELSPSEETLLALCAYQKGAHQSSDPFSPPRQYGEEFERLVLVMCKQPDIKALCMKIWEENSERSWKFRRPEDLESAIDERRVCT